MKKLFLTLLCFMGSWIVLNGQPEYTIDQKDPGKIRISLITPDIKIREHKTAEGVYNRIEMEGFVPSSEIGQPELPVFAKLLEIPLCDQVSIKIIDTEYDMYNVEESGITYDLYPVQPPVSKSDDSRPDLIRSEEIYRTNDFYSLPLVSIEKRGIMRDLNLAALYLSPVQYNPVTRQLKIFRNLEVEITFENADFPATYELKNLHSSLSFPGAHPQILNSRPEYRDQLPDRAIRYLIVANGMFRGELDEFIAWKKRKGFIVDVAYTDDPQVGNTNVSIQSYIRSYYDNATMDNPAPTYVLLVGDVEQLPSFQVSGHVTDLYYFTWTANDDLPDCYYGRFSAQNQEQLRVLIEKTLRYEQYLLEDNSYLGDAVLVAGSDPYWSRTHANGQINYLANNYINTANHYNTVHKYLYNSSSQAATIRSRIGQGVGFANYTAHCESSGWTDPEFSTSHIGNMPVNDRYGLFVGNCCQSAAFDESECFAEALVRASRKGAYAYIGGSDLTYWDEDYYWTVGNRSSITSTTPQYNAQNLGAYDRLFHTHGEPFEEWYTSNGSIITAGNLAVESSTSNLKDYYWEIYHLLGDPSVMTYLSFPSEMEIDAPSDITVGSSELDVQTVPYAYVALTFEETVIAAGFTGRNGDITLQFDPLTVPGEYEVAVSAQNYVTAFHTVQVTVTEGPYVSVAGFTFSNGTAPEAGSELIWDLKLHNLGIETANNVSVKLTGSSPLVTFLSDSVFVGNIAADGEIIEQNVFSVKLDSLFEDGMRADFWVKVYYNSESNVRKFTYTLLAPKFERRGYTVKESNGNNNGIIDPGETIVITVFDINKGHMNPGWGHSALISRYSKATVENDLFLIHNIGIGELKESHFTVHIDESVPRNSIIPFYYRIKKYPYELLDTIYVNVGNEVENFAGNDFNSFDWVNDASKPWIITDAESYDGSYSARSPRNLSNYASSTLKITMDVKINDSISYYRKVSSENGCDFFIFYIDGILQEQLSGNEPWDKSIFPVEAGTRTFTFEYSKDFSASWGEDCAWIDHILFPATGEFISPDTVVNFPDKVSEYPVPEVTLFPNPANSIIHLQSDHFIQGVDIIDLTGKVIQSANAVHDMATTVNIANLSSGIYFVRIIFNSHNSVVKKLIKR